MTWLAQLMALFPTAVLLGAAGCVVLAVRSASAWPLLVAVAIVYGLPLLAFRWHERRFPLKEGASHLIGGPYSPWWGGHQLQVIFIAFPMLETLLRIVPGLYSAWLRAWGSRIGKNVYWTPAIRIGDRSLLDIGDEVIFGYDVGMSSHLIKRTRKNVLLYVKRITIGSGCFVGAGAVIGPGVVVEAGATIDIGEHLYPRTHVPRDRKRQTRAADPRAA
jgi:acetyltransferase-like isoleucine patch superfamily enzyme